MTHSVAESGDHITLTTREGPRGLVVATLGGELDIVSAPVLREQLLGLLRPGASQLVVDLSSVGYADASGLAVLLGSQRRARLLGGSLRLAAPQPGVAKLLMITGMSRHFDIYPTVQAATAGQRPAVPAQQAAVAATAESLRRVFSGDDEVAAAQGRAG